MKKHISSLTSILTSLGRTPYLSVLAIILMIGCLISIKEYIWHMPSALWDTPVHQKIDITRPTNSSFTLSSGSEKPPKNLDTGSIACTKEYVPVCGNDGHTYSNQCIARNQGISEMVEGACPSASYPSVSGESSGTYDTGTYLTYTNPSYGYRLAFPKYVHYQGYGARDGAQHTIAVGLSSTGITSFETADVRVYYYQKSAPKDIGSGLVRVATESGVLVIETSLATDPKIQKIVDTIQMSAR